MAKESSQINHILVPKHEVLTKEQEDHLMQSFNISKKQLPKMFAKDAAIQYLNPKKGDIIKVTRASETSGKTVFYRAVVE